MIHAAIYSLLAIVALTALGNWACRLFMNLIGLKDAVAATAETSINVGRYIGGLERAIIAISLIAHSWEAIAAVIALKTIARFKELDKQIPAEYFLIGSLFSLLWAILITGIWSTYDHYVGIDVARALISLLGKSN
jgi:hypothetical protein